MTIVTIIDNSNKDNPETCDIWDTDNNSDNWEPETMTIFVIWQLIVTLDSIRNSCDVYRTPNIKLKEEEQQEIALQILEFYFTKKLKWQPSWEI